MLVMTFSHHVVISQDQVKKMQILHVIFSYFKITMFISQKIIFVFCKEWRKCGGSTVTGLHLLEPRQLTEDIRTPTCSPLNSQQQENHSIPQTGANPKPSLNFPFKVQHGIQWDSILNVIPWHCPTFGPGVTSGKVLKTRTSGFHTAFNCTVQQCGLHVTYKQNRVRRWTPGVPAASSAYWDAALLLPMVTTPNIQALFRLNLSTSCWPALWDHSRVFSTMYFHTYELSFLAHDNKIDTWTNQKETLSCQSYSNLKGTEMLNTLLRSGHTIHMHWDVTLPCKMHSNSLKNKFF